MTGDALRSGADGAALYYELRGAGEPLVLLSGQSNDHRWWEPVRADFEECAAVATPLVIGFLQGDGGSPRPDDG